jgi:hypothetical protein
MSDIATLIRAHSGTAILSATDLSAYQSIRGTGNPSWQQDTPQSQICIWAALSSVAATVASSLSAAGFINKQVGGLSIGDFSGSSQFSTNSATVFYRTSAS